MGFIPKNSLARHYLYENGAKSGQPFSSKNIFGLIKSLCLAFDGIRIDDTNFMYDSETDVVFWKTTIPEREIEVKEIDYETGGHYFSQLEYFEPQFRGFENEFDMRTFWVSNDVEPEPAPETSLIVDGVKYSFPSDSTIETREKVLLKGESEIIIHGIEFKWPKYGIDVFIEGTGHKSVSKILKLVAKYQQLA